MTVLESILGKLQACAQFNQDYEAQPVCILWTDGERHWEQLAPAFRNATPNFFTLADLDEEKRSGPALWLKCVLAGIAPGATLNGDGVPILYLPGVSRGIFREPENCPAALRPLIELQHRGVIWSHPNGKDWTISAYLSSHDGGLGLDLSKDQQTSVALQQALTKLSDFRVDRLFGQRIDSDFLLALLHPDPGLQVLLWLSDSEHFRAALSPDGWNSFATVCRGTYRFDPDKDGQIRAAELLAAQQGAWKETWARFKERPQRYPGVAEWLRRACPAKQMELALEEKPYDAKAEPWPQVNEKAERDLRDALKGLQTKPQKEIRHTILTLAKQHEVRSDWVWAELGQSPLAAIWRDLAALAAQSGKLVAGATLEQLAQSFENAGWEVDRSVVQLLAAVLSEEDRLLVSQIIRALYLPWLEESAVNFQAAAKDHGKVFRVCPATKPAAGTVLLFADALRLDVGRMLLDCLMTKGLDCSMTYRWSAIPAVTPTAKPAVSPIAHLLGADLAPDKADIAGFRPIITAENKPLTTDRFRRLLDREGFQFLGATETGDPAGLAWTEHGQLDSDGHHEGARMAARCAEHIRILAERVQRLLAAGWQNVRIITDHGWLLMPGGLPKLELRKYLTDTRWGRCAILNEAANSELPAFPWAWSPAVQVVCAPGVQSFVAGLEYTHGGLSLQESRIPEIHVRGAAVPISVCIVSVKWINLRCRVILEGDFANTRIDLRLRPADASSSVVESLRAPSAEGVASLALARDELIGDSASAVVLDSTGTVVQKLSLVLGEDAP